VPLRPPAVLARSAAALDILSGGRLVLGLGAGYFRDAIAAMGAPARSAAAYVDALAEAIEVIRSLWTPGPPVRFEGRYYHLDGARPGPLPAHPIEIWVGSYKRRMLELTGRQADGWVPSSAYAAPEELAEMTRILDAAATDAGRDPAEVRRIYNVSGALAADAGPLAELALTLGISTFIIGPGANAELEIRRFAGEIAPAVRDIVERERREPSRVPRERPAAAASPPPSGTQGQQMLLAVHAHLREELDRLRDVVRQVAAGRVSAAAARSHLEQLTLRQNFWAIGAFCASYCRVVGIHHAIEDARMFPDLEAGDRSLGPVLRRLAAEHAEIGDLLTETDRALAAMIADEGAIAEVERAVDRLGETLLAHLAYEEEELLEPIGRLGLVV
jgi:hemerythrin-like domain-containing protein